MSGGAVGRRNVRGRGETEVLFLSAPVSTCLPVVTHCPARSPTYPPPPPTQPENAHPPTHPPMPTHLPTQELSMGHMYNAQGQGLQRRRVGRCCGSEREERKRESRGGGEKPSPGKGMRGDHTWGL